MCFTENVSTCLVFLSFLFFKGLLSDTKQSEYMVYSPASSPRSVYKPLWYSPPSHLNKFFCLKAYSGSTRSGVNYHGVCTSYKAWIIKGRRKCFTEDVHVWDHVSIAARHKLIPDIGGQEIMSPCENDSAFVVWFAVWCASARGTVCGSWDFKSSRWPVAINTNPKSGWVRGGEDKHLVVTTDIVGTWFCWACLLRYCGLFMRASSKWVVPGSCNVHMNQSYSPIMHVWETSKAKDNMGVEVTDWMAFRTSGFCSHSPWTNQCLSFPTWLFIII